MQEEHITIYFHIGQPKTGSSAIQAFLNHNRSVLSESHHILYPNLNNTDPGSGYCHNHTRYFEDALASDRVDDCAEGIQRCINYCMAKGTDKVIFSNESFFTGNWPEKLAGILKKFKCNFRFILYLRRQDHWLESSWKQWGYKNSRHDSFLEYTTQWKCYWNKVLSIWFRFFSKSDFIVRPFEKESIGEDVVLDFLGLLSVNDLSGFLPPPRTNASMNVGFVPEIMQILSLCRDQTADIHNHSLVDFLASALPDRYKKTSPFASYGLLSPVDRYNLVKSYQPSNELLGKLIFGPGRENFFREPIPDPEAEWTPPDRLNLEQLVPILIELFMYQHKELMSCKRLPDESGIKQLISASRIVREGKFNSQVTGLTSDNGLISFIASGSDPIIILPRITFPDGQFTIRITMTAPAETTTQLFYKKYHLRSYREIHSIRNPVLPGMNVVYFNFFTVRPMGRLRFDPGCHPGRYIIHRIEIFKA